MESNEELNAAYKAFAEKSMPWILGEMLDDSDRLVRATAHTAFAAGYKAGKERAAIEKAPNTPTKQEIGENNV